MVSHLLFARCRSSESECDIRINLTNDVLDALAADPLSLCEEDPARVFFSRLPSATTLNGPGQTHLSIGCGSVIVRPVAGNPLRVPDRSCTGRRDGHRGSFGRQTLPHNRSSSGKTLSCVVHFDQFDETPVLVDLVRPMQKLGNETVDRQQHEGE
jgi:hypothetical protein